MRTSRTLFPPAPKNVSPIAGRLAVSDRAPRDGAWLLAANPRLAAEADEQVAGQRQKEEEAKQTASESMRLVETQQRLEVVLKRYLDGITQLDRIMRSLPAAQAEDAVDLAFVIAKAIVGRELGMDRQRAVSLVMETLKMLDNPRDVTVRIGSVDLANLRAESPDLFASPHISFIEDAQLAIGGCVVETPKRIVDLSLESRLETIRQKLTQLLEQGAEVSP